MRTLLALPFLNVHLHESPSPVLELEWLSYIGSTEFRAAALQALALSQQHRVRAWVADDRHLGAVRPRDLDWAEQAILVPLSQRGLRRFAHVEPLDALNRHVVGSMYSHSQPALGFELATFSSLAEARAWASGLA
jgi:hypothetical protein